MRIKELVCEYKSSPNVLMIQASKINAICGVEFELIYPNLINEDNEDSFEDDMSYDDSYDSISDIIDFFSYNDVNGYYRLQKLKSTLKDEFYEWFQLKIEKEWSNAENSVITDYVNEQNFDSDEEKEDEYEYLMKGRGAYSKLKDDWEQEFQSDNAEECESEWIRENYRYVSKVLEQHDIIWPYKKISSTKETFEDVASSLQKFLKKDVEVFHKAHARQKDIDTYYVEPDSSLQPNYDDGGVEIVSGAMSFSEMCKDIITITNWAHQNDCYTNNSTGLHMNVSIPGFSEDNIDFLKLLLFIGDKYILNKFERGSCSYCISSYENLHNILRETPHTVPLMLQQIKTQYMNFSKNIVGRAITEKYRSVHFHQNRIEFRSPGGNWLESDIEELQATMARFIVALNAATNPMLYKKEYYKKLYVYLSSITNDKTNLTNLLAQYISGNITKEEAKQQILQRKEITPQIPQ